MTSNLYQKSFFVLVLLILIIISFFIVKPFMGAILTGVTFSYIFYPLYKKINGALSRKNISALITAVVVVVAITLPLFFVLNTLSQEARIAYILSRQKFSGAELIEECQLVDRPGCDIVRYVFTKTQNPQIKYYIDTSIEGATTKITEAVSNIIFTIPVFLLHIFIALFVMFFLFRDGAVFIDKIGRLLPLKDSHRKRVFKRLNDMTYAVVYGSIIIAIIQGTLGGIGFFIFGVPAPLLWGAVMIFASLIPYVGSSIVWFPAAVLLLLNGYFDLDTTLMIKGVLLILYGVFVVGTIDNILKPKIIGDKGGLHPVLVLLGVVGGLQFFGVIGILVGPILLAILVTFLNIYEEEKGVTV